MGKTIVFLALILFFIPTITKGADWELLTKRENPNIEVFIDNEQIKHISKNVLTARVKIVFSEQKETEFENVKFIVSYTELDCVDEKYRHLEFSSYYLDGSYDTGVYENWRFIKPETIGEDLHKYLCKNGK